MKPKVYASCREQWCCWLKQNHRKVTEVWLVYYKKHTGKPSVSYRESVEEALCFGWIDGIKRRIDEQTYAHRFTPRRKTSKWSTTNTELAERLIKEGRMARSGLEAFDRRIPYDETVLAAACSQENPLSPETEAALKANAKAWKFFKTLPPSHQRRYGAWLDGAKRPETRKRRLAEGLRSLAQGKKLGMK